MRENDPPSLSSHSACGPPFDAAERCGRTTPPPFTLCLWAHTVLLLSSRYVKFVSSLRKYAAPGVDTWGTSIKLLMGAVLCSGSLMLITKRHMEEKVLKDPTVILPAAGSKTKKKKEKMSMKDSMKFLLSSPYIRNLATLVVSYGMCINIVEVSWKSKLKLAFPNPNDYSAFMGNFSSATGTVTLFMMLLGRSIFRRFGWRTAALVTPTMIGVTGACPAPQPPLSHICRELTQIRSSQDSPSSPSPSSPPSSRPSPPPSA